MSSIWNSLLIYHDALMAVCCTRVGQKVTSRCIHFGLFIFSAIRNVQFELYCHRTVFHVGPTATEVLFVMPSDGSFSFPLTEVAVLCYEPSSHNRFHLVIAFKFVSGKILIQRRKRMIIARRRIPLI
jgi:hypothetical protein